MKKIDIQLFADEDEVIVDETDQLYLDQIETLKEQLALAVDPKEHAKLKAQHKKLLDDFVNKRPAVVIVPKDVRPVKEIAQELSSIADGNISNRNYIAKVLEYRTAHIKETGRDPFTDFGSEGSSQETPETKQVALVLQTLVDENESPLDFRLRLNNVLKDDPQLLKMIDKRKNTR